MYQGTKNSGQSRPSFDLMTRLPLAYRFAAAAPRLTRARRSKRSRVDVRHAGGAVKRHELTIGRGIEALYNDRRQCTVTYAPPGAG